MSMKIEAVTATMSRILWYFELSCHVSFTGGSHREDRSGQEDCFYDISENEELMNARIKGECCVCMYDTHRPAGLDEQHYH